MDAIQIFVEGSGDVLFLRQLLSHVEPALRGRWTKCFEPKQDESFDESGFQIPTLTFKTEWQDHLIVIRAMNGVDSIFPMFEPMLTSFAYSINTRSSTKIVKNVFIVDADDSVKDNGSGGILKAKQKIQVEKDKCTRLGVECAGFAMPNNESDGTLENLLERMVPESHREVIDGCWNRFVSCARSHGAILEPPLKSLIDVYAKMFNRKAHGSPFPSSSFGDTLTWDWNASVLEPLKSFLKFEVLDYCANRTIRTIEQTNNSLK